MQENYTEVYKKSYEHESIKSNKPIWQKIIKI